MGVDFLSKEVDMKQKTICFYFWGSLETESNFIEVFLINVKELWEILEESYWCYLITKSCPALCKPTDYSTPGFPALHYLPEFAQIHVHWHGGAIQTSHPPSPSSPLALNLSQHQSFSQRVSSLYQVAKVLELLLQHQSFQSIFKVDFYIIINLFFYICDP